MSELVEFEKTLLALQGDMEEKVYQLEEKLIDMPQIEIPVDHLFHGGNYVRKCVVPAGVVVTGETYKEDHLVFVVSGEISFTTDEGCTRVKGPEIFKAKAGAKRAGYAHTETTWMTIHRTDKTTVEEVEEELWFTNDEKLNKWIEKWQV